MNEVGPKREPASTPSVWKNPLFTGRIPELDGLRGIAILLVLIWHYLYGMARTVPGTWGSYAIAPFRLTWSGVDLFFVLSGFLIGGILLDARNSANYFGTFYLRRIHRIFPVYYAWYLMFLLGRALLVTEGTGRFDHLFSDAVPGWMYALFLQNFGMSVTVSYGAEWLSVTWSLAIEEQFYLLLPLAVRKLSERRLVQWVGAFVIAAPVLRWAFLLGGNDFYAAYTLLPCRADALGLGVLAAVLVRRRTAWDWLIRNRRVMWATLGLFLPFLALLHWRPTGWHMTVVGYSVLAAFYFVVLLNAVVQPGPFVRAVLRRGILQWLGKVSYSVYMVHLALLSIFHIMAFGQTRSIEDPISFLVTAAALGATFLIAEVSWRYYEHPLIRRAQTNYRY